jgi:hypothetical protein
MTLSLNNLTFVQGFKIVGGSVNESIYSINNSGDINKDGIADIIIGAPYYGPGIVYIIYGKNSTYNSSINLDNLLPNQGFKIMGVNNGDRCGRSVNIGDVNYDRIDDIIIGAPYAGSIQ